MYAENVWILLFTFVNLLVVSSYFVFRTFSLCVLLIVNGHKGALVNKINSDNTFHGDNVLPVSTLLLL